MERKIRFTVNGIRVDIEAETPRRLRREGEAPQLSICGTIDGGTGQVVDSVRQAGEGESDVERLCDIWDEFHLQPVPADIVAELEAILDRLDGAALGEAPDVSDAPDIGGDIIDSRDVIAACEIYRAAVVAMGVDPVAVDADFNRGMPEGSDEWEAEKNDIVSEYVALRELNSDGESYGGDWLYGATLIADSYFTEYAQELASDIGAIDKDSSWPNTFIDWEAAADALKQDYTSIEWKGETYWVR